MHEVSVCQSILKTIEAEFKPKELEQIRKIFLRVGILSNIDAGLLKHVFKFVILDGPFKNSTLEVETVDIKACCDNCGNVFKVERYTFICPVCECSVTNIIEGRELEIKKIILESAYEEINQ